VDYAGQNPTLSLAGDAAAAKLIIDAEDGPVVLVGHSYGGAVITEAGTHPNVAALVYIAAFAADKGESVSTLIAGFPPGGPQPPILPPRDGFLFLDRDKFQASFAGDLPAGQAAFMADSQVPWNMDAPAGGRHHARAHRAGWTFRPGDGGPPSCACGQPGSAVRTGRRHHHALLRRTDRGHHAGGTAAVAEQQRRGADQPDQRVRVVSVSGVSRAAWSASTSEAVPLSASVPSRLVSSPSRAGLA
jgi:pimeloyl-ACP methyl ester carboxylesterase